MKTQLIKVLAIIFVMIPTIVVAQSDFDKLYEKYAGKDGVTSINISPEMFQFLGGIDMSDSSEDAKDAQNVMEQLSGLKMLVYETPDGKTLNDFYKEVKKALPFKNYAELMSINDEDSDIKFLVKKQGKDRISEMLMIVKSDDEVLVMSMLGDLDMNAISEIGKSLDMKGMDNLDKINK